MTPLDTKFGQGRDQGSRLDGAEADSLPACGPHPGRRLAGDPLQRVVIGSRALLASDGGPTTALARPSRFVSSGRLGHPVVQVGRGDRAVERGLLLQDSHRLFQVSVGHLREAWARGGDVARGLIVPACERRMRDGEFNPSSHQSGSPVSAAAFMPPATDRRTLQPEVSSQ